MYHEVHVPKSLISKIFEPFLKSCTSEVHVPRGRVPRGLTVYHEPQKDLIHRIGGNLFTILLTVACKEIRFLLTFENLA